ncbi:Protein CBG22986 [Caenorhabditis briggsae]|uniref:Protein CBG22986 n=1 Tax=Caenorhabditis briggsae TaxID=6238 RepID=A8Y3I2_CAEBR|nr:Protein CBG22986 [Caenorhabditis briggsae]CAP39451.1 Protein CBG22986 [Caenorhabditis briggsae]
MPINLHQFPKELILEVLRNVDLRGLILYSLLSINSKKYATSLNYKASTMEISFGRSLTIQFIFLNSISNSYLKLEVPNDGLFIDKKLPRGAEMSETRLDGLEFFNTGERNIGEVVEHFSRTFHCSEQKTMEFHMKQKLFKPGQILQRFGNPSTLTILGDDEVENSEILETFRRVDTLYLQRKDQDLQSVLIRNFNCLVYGLLGSVPLSLDDLLCLNSTSFTATGAQISQREINLFFKLWIAGSNPRLAHLEIQIWNQILNREVILKGIPYVAIPDDVERIVESSGEFLMGHRIQGGFDVWRRDGTKGTILIDLWSGDEGVELIVWK